MAKLYANGSDEAQVGLQCCCNKGSSLTLTANGH